MKKKKRKILLIIIVLLIVITGAVFWGIKQHLEKVNEEEINSGIHAIVIGEDVPFYEEAEVDDVKQIKLLNKGENVYILDEFEAYDIEWYKIKVDKKTNGYVRAEYVDYYEEVNSEKVLVSDVSQFNVGKNFETAEDYEVFLIENEISYVYIRAGGRGYGTDGNFYYDENYEMYVEACEYLEIPYGFYFLDEALDSEEIDEEVEFIKNFLNENSGENCLLPVALDVEKHDGEGRADTIWDTRYKLVRELISDLDTEGIDSIVYTNAQTANLYLSKLRTKFWIAYYPEEDEIPDYWYFDTDQPGASNTRLQKRTIGWQFTEHGVGDDISEDLDVSLMKKDFYK